MRAAWACKAAAMLAAALLGGPGAQAASLQFCDTSTALSPAALDEVLALSVQVQAQLEARGARAAVVARDGLGLQRWGQRYSHAGVVWQDGPAGAWTVRQLYYACGEGHARLFDQGLGAFISGSRGGAVRFLRLLLLPVSAEAALHAHATDARSAHAWLHPHYSANAHAFGTRFQNCNQWLAELMAAAWGGPFPVSAEAGAAQGDRAAAQAWLQREGYTATRIHAGPLLLAAAFSPWLHLADHPAADRASGQLQVVLPQDLMDWAAQRHPGSRQLEFCRNARELWLREDGPPLPADCQPAPDARTWRLNSSGAPEVRG
ncbi:DUF2145 domain-containing protein [Roseateles sp. BYS180W]|uniref:DUF2145 domain-containing protein n=1 Tax=Roseateles rivi TaxID=3299028 RepID=A0ABW7FTY1_9BURK